MAVVMRTTRPVIVAFLAMLMVGSVCGEERMSNEEVVNRIEAEFVPGMPRSKVEEKLAELPVNYVYVPREDLELIDQATSGGVPLSGRFDISTPYEGGGFRLKRVLIFVNLDEQEHVVDVRIKKMMTGL